MMGKMTGIVECFPIVFFCSPIFVFCHFCVDCMLCAYRCPVWCACGAHVVHSVGCSLLSSTQESLSGCILCQWLNPWQCLKMLQNFYLWIVVQIFLKYRMKLWKRNQQIHKKSPREYAGTAYELFTEPWHAGIPCPGELKSPCLWILENSESHEVHACHGSVNSSYAVPARTWNVAHQEMLQKLTESDVRFFWGR